MGRKSDGQYEIVLENRQLLAAFFVIVGFCGVFFALGYIVGRNTPGESESPGVESASAAAGSTAKPSPMPPPAYQPSPEPAADAPAEQTATASTDTADLNFYQSVEESKPEAKLDAPEPAQPAPPAATSTTVPLTSTNIQPAAAPAQSAPQIPQGILVQISALTRQEDANSLVKLLKDKNLPVMVVAGTTDRLFHVVVGPYASQKEADRTKALLELEGFRPIVKR